MEQKQGQAMLEDQAIITLYWERDESAIRESDRKYGGLCRQVAGNILPLREDVEECLNDTWLGAWNAMPTARPEFLSAFLCRIVKNLAWKRTNYNLARKRSPEALLSLEELGDCVSGESSPEQQVEARWLGAQISEFLWSCKKEERDIFLHRYWYFDSVSEIARQFSVSESKVKTVLFRMRKRLRVFLQEKGVAL